MVRVPEKNVIAAFYHKLMPEALAVPRGFLANDAPGFQNGVIAPVFLTRPPRALDLKQFCHWYAQRRDQSPHSEPRAYVDILLGRGAHDQSEALALVSGLGWERTREKSFLVWRRPVAAEEGCWRSSTHRLGTDRDTDAAFWESMANFSRASATYQRRFERFLRSG